MLRRGESSGGNGFNDQRFNREVGDPRVFLGWALDLPEIGVRWPQDVKEVRKGDQGWETKAEEASGCISNQKAYDSGGCEDVLEEVAVGNEKLGVTAGRSAMQETGLDNGELAGLR